MFNLYQFAPKKGEEDREPDVIGHDRFYQERSRYPKRKKVTRRTRSASEFSGSTLALAQKRAQFKRQHSQILENGGSQQLLSEKRDSLTKVFFFKRSSSVPRHEYSALRLENGAERGGFEKQLRDGMFATCQQYLEISGRYDLQSHLGNIGSRPDKQWFVVKDRSLGADRLLSLVEIPSHSAIVASSTTREILLDLFRSLHHPYIHPVLDIEFWDLGAAFVSPLNACGSLRDLIYGAAASWDEDHDKKYPGRGVGLPYRQVQCLGRQILEALLFLSNRNFPKFYHLHSGNVIIQNGVARLAALENPLLGLPPKYPTINESEAFGYVLFEMTAGYELPKPPSAAHLQIELERTPRIAELLEAIFAEPTPSVEEMIRFDLFRGVELRELRRATGISYTTPADVNELLEMVKVTAVPSPAKSCAPMAVPRRYRSRSRSRFYEFETIGGTTYMQQIDNQDPYDADA